MDPNAYAEQVLLSLPPKEGTDLRASLAHLATLCPTADQDALLAVHDTRACVDPGAAGSSQMEHIGARVQANRDKLYQDKGRTHRMTVREENRDDGRSVIHVRTYAELLDAPNLRSGYWAASWEIVFLGERECELGGTIEVHSCYNENTNVHMRATRDYPLQPLGTEEEKVHSLVATFEKRTMSYEEQLATVVADAIDKHERALYQDLQHMCDEIDGSLKRIRRILPITKTKFKWDSATSKHVKLLNAEGSLKT